MGKNYPFLVFNSDNINYKKKMSEQRQRCVVRYQIATYSGDEIVYCDVNDDTDIIKAKAKRQIKNKK